MRAIFLACGVALLGPVLAWAHEADLPMPELGQTWVELDGETYGAKPNELGPIGGGKGYQRIVTTGQYVVKTVEELLAAMAKAQAGETVFIDGAAKLDFTGLTYAAGTVIEIPAGVTLASNRGQDGAPGALIYSDALQTSRVLQAKGPGVRITGLRLRGADTETRDDHHRRAYGSDIKEEKDQSAYYYKLPVTEGIFSNVPDTEVDNCEISGWSHGGVHLWEGTGHHVHHNYIHHNQRQGLGYGVVLGYGQQVSVLIEYNVFDYNRHSIAATGKPGNAYEACHNVEVGHAISHYFDMHGGSDRKDGTNVAGDSMKVHHNTFQRAQQPAIVIRGVPGLAEIHHNWFSAPEPGPAVMRPWPTGGATQVKSYRNAYGLEKPAVQEAEQ